MRNAARLDEALKKAGIPIDGCDSLGNVFFSSNATPQQKLEARSIAASFDWSAEDIKEPPLTNDEIRWIRAQMKIQSKS